MPRIGLLEHRVALGGFTLLSPKRLTPGMVPKYSPKLRTGMGDVVVGAIGQLSVVPSGGGESNVKGCRLLPNRDVTPAVAGERLTPPTAPALTQIHPGK